MEDRAVRRFARKHLGEGEQILGSVAPPDRRGRVLVATVSRLVLLDGRGRPLAESDYSILSDHSASPGNPSDSAAARPDVSLLLRPGIARVLGDHLEPPAG